MKRACYICIEGVEGVGKTTQARKLAEYLRNKGYKVLETKEPGTNHLPITMSLRQLMLDGSYDDSLTVPARELISQAIRSIHLEKLIVPALSEYDFIIQDRGILSGYAYGVACGNTMSFLKTITQNSVNSAFKKPNSPELIYDTVIYLRGNVSESLERAKASKQEFMSGDVIESRGESFLASVSGFMDSMSMMFKCITIDIDGKSADDVHLEILSKLKTRL
ncbi:MAG: dTMP kinase [Nitrososphaerales archaeon]